MHKADLISFDSRLKKLDDEFQGVKMVGKGAEQLATRLADDAMAGLEELRNQVTEQEFRISELFSYIG